MFTEYGIGESSACTIHPMALGHISNPNYVTSSIPGSRLFFLYFHWFGQCIREKCYNLNSLTKTQTLNSLCCPRCSECFLPSVFCWINSWLWRPMNHINTYIELLQCKHKDNFFLNIRGFNHLSSESLWYSRNIFWNVYGVIIVFFIFVGFSFCGGSREGAAGDWTQGLPRAKCTLILSYMPRSI